MGPPAIPEARKRKMIRIIGEMRSKMDELDKLREEIAKEKITLTDSPQKTKAILEEIKVPPLKLLKESSKH